MYRNEVPNRETFSPLQKKNLSQSSWPSAREQRLPAAITGTLPRVLCFRNEASRHTRSRSSPPPLCTDRRSPGLREHGEGVPAPRRRGHPHRAGLRRRRRPDVHRLAAAAAALPRLLLRLARVASLGRGRRRSIRSQVLCLLIVWCACVYIIGAVPKCYLSLIWSLLDRHAWHAKFWLILRFVWLLVVLAFVTM